MQLLDKYYNSIKIGDTVSLFGEIGQVNEEMGALGIYFKEGVNWELVKNKLKKMENCKKTLYFCYNETFVSFWEIMNNLTGSIEDVCHVVVKFCSEKETYFTIEKESRIIGIRKEKIYLKDAVSVSFDREKLVKLTIHKDVVRTICEHFGWDKLDISISEYELDYEERKYVSTLWYCGKDTFERFLSSHKEGFDISDNRNAQCPAYGWIDE